MKGLSELDIQMIEKFNQISLDFFNFENKETLEDLNVSLISKRGDLQSDQTLIFFSLNH